MTASRNLPVIEVQGLGKRFYLEQWKKNPDSRSLQFQFGQWLSSMFSPSADEQGWGATEKEEFWALREIEFSVQAGERVAIIGRNGAGKSTLLKILSRITEPTEGLARLRGRVASLLEIGTGFHFELSGR
ncbi:MAG TPA: ATP-binding cassette domain-containing protein, partial [Candidatus Ozemobacteraceae bacterium]|nr:ATP-binding cassette domain-containing protein [Candidatus Ozemobacteraceae bacterium]